MKSLIYKTGRWTLLSLAMICFALTANSQTLVFGIFTESSWPNEPSWEIVGEDGVVVMSGDGYDATYSAYLEDGCYTVNMYDSYGDGWTGATLELYVGNNSDALVYTLGYGTFGTSAFGVNADGCESSANGGCTDPNASNYDPEAQYDDGSCQYAGCTDPTAINYNYYATIDDGSCEYCDGEGSVFAQLYVCTFANGGQVELQIVDDQGNEVIYVSGLSNSSITYYSICLEAGVCYTVNMFNNTGPFGWYSGYYWINGNGVQYNTDALDAGLETESTFFSIDGTCSPIPGCTDPEADNYNPDANEDDGSCYYLPDCDNTAAVITVTAGTFAYEVQWSITNENGDTVAGGGAPYLGGVCLEDGCYTVVMLDTFGDGWNGAQLTITGGGAVIFSGTLDSGNGGADAFGVNADGCEANVNSGCTDPNAANYDPTAAFDDGSCQYAGCTDPNAINYSYYATIDDGSCQYCDGEGSIAATLYICAFANGGQLELQIVDDEGNEVIYASGLSDYAVGYYTICLQPGTCYTVNMLNNTGPFGWYGGYFWVTINNGTQLVTGQLYDGEESGSIEFSIDGTCGPVWGCTDPNALNYNADATANDNSCIYPYYGCTDSAAMNYDPYATTDDGSCTYPEDCLQNLVQFVLNGGTFENEISWYVYDADGNWVSGSYWNNGYACVGDGCYSLYMYDNFGDGWNGGSLDVYLNGEYTTSYTMDEGSYSVQNFGINTEGCDEIAGCTDQLALNYNYLATTDDGSCIYAEDCNANLITIYISTQIWGSEVSWNLMNAEGVVVASGANYNSWDAETQYVCLPDGCYEMQMNDSWGDGWNGAYYAIYGNGTYAEGSLLYGDYASDAIGVNTTCEIDGCTDPLALNYNPWATTDDGSCIYNDNGEFNGNGWEANEINIEFYPNPVNQEITVNVSKLNALEGIQVVVTDITGQVVQNTGLSNSDTYRSFNVNVNELSAGYYLLRIANGGRVAVKPFIKQ